MSAPRCPICDQRMLDKPGDVVSWWCVGIDADLQTHFLVLSKPIRSEKQTTASPAKESK